MLQLPDVCKGRDIQMCLLNEDSCRQRLKQGKKMKQALAKSYPTCIDGD